MQEHSQIIERARQGDTGAFAEIYQIYGGMVYGVSFRMLGSAEDAQEVVQDVFVAAHRGLRGFAGQASLKTWLYRITVNTALNAIRRRKKTRAEVPLAEGVDVEDQRQDVRELIEREKDQDTIRRLLEQVSPEHRACLVLRAQQGLSYEEIAQVLKININTVRSRLKRAREAVMRSAKEGGIHEM